MKIDSIYNGDCLEVLRTFEDNCLDSIVTDPPYGLSFMGKKWDYDVPSIDLWAECLRVLKPGGYLLAFAGTRTQHRMAVRIEDAGFIIRDMIAWLYGSGFPKSLNIGKNINSLETKEWTNIGKALDNINKNDYIEVWKKNIKNVKAVETQLEKNQIEVGFNIIKNFSAQSNAQENFNLKKSYVNAIIAELSLCEALLLQTEIKGHIVTLNVEVNTKPQQNPAKYAELLLQSQILKHLDIFIVECDVKELLKEKTYQIIKVEEALMILRGKMTFSNLEIINVLYVALIEILKLTILNQSKTFQSLDMMQKMECVYAINVIITEYMMECLIINMVNIAKQIVLDKLQGNEREVVGERKQRANSDNSNIKMNGCFSEVEIISKGTSQYEGLGTALKPAMEMITVAMKPLSEKNFATNVIKWGTGGINIDGCRIDFVNESDKKASCSLRPNHENHNEHRTVFSSMDNKGNEKRGNPSGRFPSNVIIDGSEEVLAGFPETGNSYRPNLENKEYKIGKNTIELGLKKIVYNSLHNDSGSASRFFYTAKASQSERNLGCGMMDKKVVEGKNNNKYMGVDSAGIRSDKTNNHHPTVKPIDLMRYLCRLVTPKEGIVLDPFAGSGTTLIAAKLEDFSYIGIEREAEYCEIARNRVKAYFTQLKMEL